LLSATIIGFAWAILLILGSVLAVVIDRRQGKQQIVVTKIDKMLIQLWSGFGGTMFVFLIAMAAVEPVIVYPMLIFLYGFGTFVSGGILDFKPFKVGAIAAWVCAIFGFFQLDLDMQLILLATAILLSYIIPGHLLAAKK
jgi:hypothetical protein